MPIGKCKILKTWDSRLQFSPKRQFYSPGESVTLSCSEGYRPSPPVIKCVTNGSLPVWSETPTCQGKCETPRVTVVTGSGPAARLSVTLWYLRSQVDSRPINPLVHFGLSASSMGTLNPAGIAGGLSQTPPTRPARRPIMKGRNSPETPCHQRVHLPRFSPSPLLCWFLQGSLWLSSAPGSPSGSQLHLSPEQDLPRLGHFFPSRGLYDGRKLAPVSLCCLRTDRVCRWREGLGDLSPGAVRGAPGLDAVYGDGWARGVGHEPCELCG